MRWYVFECSTQFLCVSYIYIFYIFKNKYWVSDLSLYYLIRMSVTKNNKDECFILGHFLRPRVVMELWDQLQLLLKCMYFSFVTSKITTTVYTYTDLMCLTLYISPTSLRYILFLIPILLRKKD